MRGYLAGIVAGSLLLAGSAFGHGEGFHVLIPAVGTGCFGENFPVLMLVPEGGSGEYGDAGEASSAAPASTPPETMSPADEKPADGGGDKLLQLTSRSVARVKASREAKAIDLNGLTASDAEPLFWKGCRLYWDGEHAEALARFEAATKLNGQDARFWYYRSLAESALGRAKVAEASARRGAELQLAGLPSQDSIRQALERVQGEPRARLRQALESQRAAR
jgi:tetratricopeptide (TPR) repeat protein